MQFEPLEYRDLYEIGILQPENWPDIIPAFKFYIDSDFCIAIKVIKNDKVVGLGACTFLQETAWLAHIIVANENRNQGIGFKIVKRLLNCTKQKPVKTTLLIATDLGYPVYLKAGFRVVSEYSFLTRNKKGEATAKSEKIIPYDPKHLREIVDLDRRISGENRDKLFREHLYKSIVFVENNTVKGFYIPEFWDGPIVADNTEAGLELMKFKYHTVDKAILPSENKTGIEFLIKNGFKTADNKGIRMVLGDDIKWFPEKIFSRIGGNLG